MSKKQRQKKDQPILEQTVVKESRFASEADANQALSDMTKVVNMKQRQKDDEDRKAKIEAKKAKAAPKMTKDGRPRLPALPRSSKPKPTRPCACGCGYVTKSKFAPGHDSRLRGWVLRVERNYVKLADIPDGEREAVQAELKRRKQEATAIG